MGTGQHGERTDATTRPDRSADHPVWVPSRSRTPCRPGRGPRSAPRGRGRVCSWPSVPALRVTLAHAEQVLSAACDSCAFVCT